MMLGMLDDAYCTVISLALDNTYSGLISVFQVIGEIFSGILNLVEFLTVK